MLYFVYLLRYCAYSNSTGNPVKQVVLYLSLSGKKLSPNIVHPDIHSQVSLFKLLQTLYNEFFLSPKVSISVLSPKYI